MFLLFLALFGLNSAHADQLSDFGYKTGDELIAQGFKSKQENGLLTLKKDFKDGKYATILSKKNEYVAERVDMGDDSLNFAKVVQMDSTGYAQSSTLCTGYGKGQSKFTCRTQTAKYCQDLKAQIKTGIFSTDLRKLSECAQIVDKIKFDSREIEEANKRAMAVISDKLQIPSNQTSNPVSRPTSIADVLEDFKGCGVLDNTWQKVLGGGKVDSSGARLPRPGDTRAPGVR